MAHDTRTQPRHVGQLSPRVSVLYVIMMNRELWTELRQTARAWPLSRSVNCNLDRHLQRKQTHAQCDAKTITASPQAETETEWTLLSAYQPMTKILWTLGAVQKFRASGAVPQCYLVNTDLLRSVTVDGRRSASDRKASYRSVILHRAAGQPLEVSADRW